MNRFSFTGLLAPDSNIWSPLRSMNMPRRAALTPTQGEQQCQNGCSTIQNHVLPYGPTLLSAETGVKRILRNCGYRGISPAGLTMGADFGSDSLMMNCLTAWRLRVTLSFRLRVNCA